MLVLGESRLRCPHYTKHQAIRLWQTATAVSGSEVSTYDVGTIIDPSYAASLLVSHAM